jgi:signal recognition particle subunit SRP19
MTNKDYEGKKIAVWMAYFNAESRKKGRKFKKTRLSVEDIISAANALGLDPEFFDKIHPGSRIKGVIMVKKIGTKYSTIRKILDYINSRNRKTQ